MSLTSKEMEFGLGIVAKWIANNYNVNIKYHKGSAIYADMTNDTLHIPSINFKDPNVLTLARGYVYHEAGHILMSKLKDMSQFPKNGSPLHSICNAVEDTRMEMEISSQFGGVKSIIREMNIVLNKKLAQAQNKEGIFNKAPVYEALCMCIYRVININPKWTPTEDGSRYFELIYDKYSEVRNCETAEDALELSKEIYEIIKEEESKKEEEKPEDNDEDETEDEIDNPEDNPEDDKEDDGKSENNSEDNDEYESDDEDSDDESESDEEKDDGEDNSGNSDDDEDKQGKGGEIETEDETSDDGEDETSDDGEDENCESEIKDTKSQETESELSEEEIEKIIKEKCGDDPEKTKALLQEIIDEYVDENSEEIGSYRAFKDADEHYIPSGDKKQYREILSEVSSTVMGMSRALEQSLRMMSKSKKSSNKEVGKIDMKKVVDISKGLDTRVFYKTKKGNTLDTAVSIIVDESGSMGGDKINAVQKLAIALGETLNKIKVPFSLTGNTTVGFRPNGEGTSYFFDGVFDRVLPLRYKHYKSFNDNWMSVRQRCTEMVDESHNIDGEILEEAIYHILPRKEKRKVIFILSDGLPESWEDMKKMGTTSKHLMEITKKWDNSEVEIYAFGIGTTAPETFYKNFIYLESIDDMNHKFFTEFSRIVTKGKLKFK